MTWSVVVLSTLYPPAVGGAETYARTLGDGLRERGHGVVVVTDHFEGARRPEHVIELREYLRRLESRDLARVEQLYFGLLPEILEALAAHPTPDVIFANSMDTAVVGRMIATTLRCPLIVNYHEHAPEDEAYGEGRMRLVYQDLHPDAIIAGSQFYLRRAQRFDAERSRLHLIHHGVDMARHATSPAERQQVRRELGLGDNQVLILSSGRFKERKNQLLLISAFAAALPRLRADSVLLLAGSTSSASSAYLDQVLAKCADLGIAEKVIVRQDLSYDDMALYNGAADIAAVPSREEGLCFAVLEAMASGVAVLTSPVPGISEIINGAECVWTAIDNDLISWSEGITQLVNDAALRRRIAGLGQRHVGERFSADLMVRRTEHLIDTLCAARMVPRGSGP